MASYELSRPIAAVYGQGFTKLFHLLDAVQNAAIRTATGVFHSSPKVSLEFEVNMMPLSLRREVVY